MGNIIPQIKDGTAQGVAKARHYEALQPPEKRLYLDPMAYAMYPGSFVQTWMGPATIETLYQWLGLAGFVELISIRTKWLDDQIMEHVATSKSDDNDDSTPCQLILLGAGYDTRGFRLDLPEDFVVWEVDQPEVQKLKISKLEWLQSHDESLTAIISDKMDSTVRFVSVDFNQDSLEEKLGFRDDFPRNALSIVIMEGVTQYIPKESTMDALKKLRKLAAPGTILLVTYVDQNVFDDPSAICQKPKICQRIKSLSEGVGEPWVSGWTEQEFAALLQECGYQVLSNTTTSHYNDKYLGPLDRKLDEQDILNLERFVVAKML